MTIIQSIFTLFFTIAFCLGLRISSDGDYKNKWGQVLYFIRKPFDKAHDRIEFYGNKNKLSPNKYYKNLMSINQAIVWLGKPLITCITCMASFWGVVIFTKLNGFNSELITPLILNSFGASFIQTFIWSLYSRYIN